MGGLGSEVSYNTYDKKEAAICLLHGCSDFLREQDIWKRGDTIAVIGIQIDNNIMLFLLPVPNDTIFTLESPYALKYP